MHAFEYDRRWKVSSAQGEYIVREYNWETSNTVPELNIKYGDNWYYWSDELRRRGWTVEELPGTPLSGGRRDYEER